MGAPVVMRRLLGPVLAVLLGLPVAAAAEPARDTPAKLTKQLTGTHAVLHYTDAAGDPDAVSPARAQQMLATLERAASTFKGYGYPVLDDGDGKVDAYVFDAGHVGGAAYRDQPGAPTTTGWINLTARASDLAVVHEMFHIAQFSSYGRLLKWISEGSAVWAESIFTEKGRASLAPSGMSLDCNSTDEAPCTGDVSGYGRWPFFTSLAQDQGPSFLLDFFNRRREAGTRRSVLVLDDALQARGTTLAATYLRATERLLTNDLTPGARVSPVPVVATLRTGAQAGETHEAAVEVDHLASHYVEIVGGAGDADPCLSAQLEVSVTAPPGIPTRPMVHRPEAPGEVAPIVTPPDGGTGAVTVPWQTCDGARAIVAMPNASLLLTQDDQPFRLVTRIVAVGEPVPPPPPTGDVEAPQLDAVKARGRWLTGRASENAWLKIRIRSAGALIDVIARDVPAGRWVIRLPKAVVKRPRTTLRVVAADATGNVSGPITVRVRR